MVEKTSIKNAEILEEYLKLLKKRRVKFSDFARKYKEKKKL
jgi:hypothetical protein